MGLSNNKIQELFEILDRQIDSIGRYNYKGNINMSQFRFLLDESGDMTYHIGILLQILAFSYLDKNYTLFSKRLIDLFLNSYLERVFVNGFYGREILYKEEYESMPPHQKHCKESAFLGLDSGVCNKWVEKNGFMVRYDISLDAISSLLSGLYFIYKNIPEYQDRVHEIVLNMYNYYRKNNYFVRDIDTGESCRFGNHHPAFIPLGFLTKQLIYIILDYQIPRNWFMEFIINNIRTYVTGLYKDKMDRFNYNGYMFMMIIHAIQDYIYTNNIKDISYIPAIKNLLREAKGEQNLFFYKVAKKFNLEYDGGFIEENWDKYVVEGLSAGLKTNNIMPLEKRLLTNRWEKTAYILTNRLGDLYYCNEDLLQAHFII